LFAPSRNGLLLRKNKVLGMLAAGDTTQTLLDAYPWLDPDDVHACLLYERLAQTPPVEGLNAD
jgi:uncharacterized protein (DUF433 family)